MRGPCSRGSWGGSSMLPSVKRCISTGRAAGAATRARRLVLSGGIGSHNTRRAGQLRRACAGFTILDWRREVREMDCCNPGVPAAWPHVPSGGGQACREAQLGGIRGLRPRYACRAPARRGRRAGACASVRRCPRLLSTSLLARQSRLLDIVGAPPAGAGLVGTVPGSGPHAGCTAGPPAPAACLVIQ